MIRSVIAMAALGLLAGALAPAAVVTKIVDYEFDGTKLKGFLAYDDAIEGKAARRAGRPRVVGPERLRQGAVQEARRDSDTSHSRLTCTATARSVDHPDDARKMATAVRENVKTWRGRAEAGLKQLTSQPNVDATKIAAIGYCFGGSTCLQLAYSGADLKAVATFHAALPTPTADEAKAIKPKVYIAHGEDDFFIPKEAIDGVQEGARRGEGEVHVREFPRRGPQLHRPRSGQGRA